jgi:hypothetical protein
MPATIPPLDSIGVRWDRTESGWCGGTAPYNSVTIGTPMRPPMSLTLLLAGVLLCATAARAADRDGAGGRVNNLKVLSNQVDDVTTVENILRSFVRPGMGDQERAKAIWTAAVKYRHQAPPPDEFLAADWEAHDPVKVFNVYGYCMCCCSSAILAALNRADGREARGRILNGHSVPEVRYGDGWHMYDASLLTFFPRPEDGVAASVDEIAGAVAAWYAKNPGYRKDGGKLLQLMRSEEWMGWKAKGPELLAHCPYYRMGYFPARTHGWDATMAEYDRKSEVYEYGYQVGHRAVFSLRPGESITREMGNRGLHVNREAMPDWDGLKARAPEDDLVYLKDVFPRYRGGLVGNGVHRYAPDLEAGDLAAGAEVFDGLATGGSPALYPSAVGKAGVAVIPMTSPYVYLGGRVAVRARRKAEGDHVAVSLSTNHGRTFAPLWSADRTGPTEAVVELGDRVLRRYAYWLKVEIASSLPGGAGLDSLVIENDIQHAPRTVPWLAEGKNTIAVSADGDAAMATRTIVGRITPDAGFSKNETSGSLGFVFENLKVDDGSCWWTGGTGSLTVPIEVPGDLTALRFSAQVRARGEKDLIRALVSTDGGKAWREAARISGPTPGTTRAFRFADWPAGTRKALLRFELSGNNTVGIFSFRADADYRDPLAASPMRPFAVVHRWKEGGRERRHEETVSRLPASYAIEAGEDAETVSVTYEMPSLGKGGR